MKPRLKTLLLKTLPIIVLVAALLFALYFLVFAIQSSDRFNRLYLWLFGASVITVLILSLIIIQRVVWLYLRRKQQEPGILLTSRLVLMFVGLSLPPVIVVYFFANLLVTQYIDTWFNVETDTALNDAIELGQIFLDTQTRQNLKVGKDLATELANIDELSRPIHLGRLLDESKAESLSIFNADGRLLAGSHLDPLKVGQNQIPQRVLSEVNNDRNYARIEPTADQKLQIRVAVPIDNNRATINIGQQPVLQALFAIPERYQSLATNIETQYHQYKKQSYQRQQLENTFVIILTIVLLISMLLAIVRAFSSARRLVKPIKSLSEGTKAIAEGDFSAIIPVQSNDELGFLIQSFNSMSSEIASASALAHRAQSDAESQRTYLEQVLSHISSGVLSIDQDLLIRLSNETSKRILHLDKFNLINQNIDYLSMSNPTLQPMVDLIKQHATAKTPHWQQEILIAEDSLRRVLLIRGSHISDKEIEGGAHVVIFDDQTIINQAQRDAAWSEVARRLAHEVKNPLTPIQLSAERMLLRFSGKLSKEDEEILNRAGQTIISQVENLKKLVNAFSDYAKPPQLKKELGGLNELITESVDLYSISHPGIQFKLNLATPEPKLLLDQGRMRQLLTNLIKNAQESVAKGQAKITISTQVLDQQLKLSITDNGSGFQQNILNNIFEPYETTKPKGSGLGLAIVKKITEEHGGQITVGNHANGAKIEILLPIG